VLGDSAPGNVAMAADYVALASHRVRIIAGNAASVDHVGRTIDFGERQAVSFIVLPDLSSPGSSSRGPSAFEPCDEKIGPRAWLDSLIAALPDERVTSVIVLGGRIGQNAILEYADRVTFVVDPEEAKDSKWNSLAGGYSSRCLSELESREVDGFMELSGYPVPR
jgi:hypothetical protein